MGVRHEICKEKLDAAYVTMGLSADVVQLGRALIRSDKKGTRKNVTQMIRKLERIRKSL